MHSTTEDVISGIINHTLQHETSTYKSLSTIKLRTPTSVLSSTSRKTPSLDPSSPIRGETPTLDLSSTIQETTTLDPSSIIQEETSVLDQPSTLREEMPVLNQSFTIRSGSVIHHPGGDTTLEAAIHYLGLGDAHSGRFIYRPEGTPTLNPSFIIQEQMSNRHPPSSRRCPH